MGKEETKSSGENNGKKAEINASEGRKGIPKKITAKIKVPPSSNARGSSSKYPSNGNKGKTAAGQPKKQISLGQPGPGNSPTGPATQPQTPGLNNPKDPPEIFPKRKASSPKLSSSSLNSKAALVMQSSLKPALTSLKKRNFKKKDDAKELALVGNLSSFLPTASTNQGSPAEQGSKTVAMLTDNATREIPTIQESLTEQGSEIVAMLTDNVTREAGGWDLNSPEPF
ncbi:hypothetical protein LINPERHAP1_LOCUS30414 [Linum perenne]